MPGAMSISKMAYIATIGFFDGVHRGHRFLIDQLIQRSKQEGLKSMLITFDGHPRKELEGKSPELLLTRSEREQMLKQSGVSQVVSFHFPVIKDMTAPEFLRVLKNQCQVERLLMGYDHHFGKDCLMRFEDYQRAGAEAGVEIEQVSAAPDITVSSTRIRLALQEGRLKEANDLLGYNYQLTGIVVHGRHIGTDLGFPTANLRVEDGKLIPKAGVYAAMVGTRSAIVNIGTNPTVSDSTETSIEVHIPDWQEDIYGQEMTVRLTDYMREERKFENKESLKEQITADLKQLARLA